MTVCWKITHPLLMVCPSRFFTKMTKMEEDITIPYAADFPNRSRVGHTTGSPLDDLDIAGRSA